MGRLAGRVAFITGAARGQGRRHAVRLAEEGADIIAVDTALPVGIGACSPAATGELAGTAGLVEAAGRRVVAVDADVRDLSALAAAADKGAAELGRIDIVLADAGMSGPASPLEMSEQSWQDMVDLHLTGVWKTIKAAVPHVVRGGRGGAVVITGSLPTGPEATCAAPHSAPKAGLITLMKLLAQELAPKGIRVNIVHPMTMATDTTSAEAEYFLFGPDPDSAGHTAGHRTLTRMPVAAVDPDDIANAIVYLVSDDGCYVTGTTHLVDGGPF